MALPTACLHELVKNCLYAICLSTTSTCIPSRAGAYKDKGGFLACTRPARNGALLSQAVQYTVQYAAQFMLKPPRPPHWGGYRLVPDQWQFWQGRKSRLHDRLRYTQEGDQWLRERLAP